ncbi:MAG TPA: ATP-dependent helicase C-terminal domain-containing protein, partial [Pirellulaceae bacterium]
EQVAATLSEALASTTGHVLVFLPGVGEILRCRDALESLAAGRNVELNPLYGDLPAELQDRALGDMGRRKVILSTNVAESSLTVEGVTAVIDSGLARQMRVHPEVGLPRLDLVPISRASADQRAGRAGRTSPGICWRLWDHASQQARPAHETPEILRCDFCESLLRLSVWGEVDVAAFPWVDPPPHDSVLTARTTLEQLGALTPAGRVSLIGHQLSRLPAHPRLARLLLAGARRGVLREASVAAALLSERDPFRVAEQSGSGPRDRGRPLSRSDLVDRVVVLQAFHASVPSPHPELSFHLGTARNILRAADQLYQEAGEHVEARAEDPPEALREILLTAFPDRLARLRPGDRERGVMVGGRGVRIDPGSRVRGERFFLCLDINDTPGDARARIVSAVEEAWLSESVVRTTDEMFFNPTRGQVEARRRRYWYDLLLDETPTAISDWDRAATLLAHQARSALSRVLPDEHHAASRFRHRVRWLAEALPDRRFPRLDDDGLAEQLPKICHGRRGLDELRDAPWLACFQEIVGFERLAEVDQLAPESWTVPSGNRIVLQYEVGKPPILAVRIQELFGITETPRVAGGRIAVVVHLLGPNHRPQQITDDLASFWKNTYPDVKKELRRRYPKHHWPDDPLLANPTRSGLSRDAPP